MQKANKDLQVTIAKLEETIAGLTRKLFGASSERTKEVPDKEGAAKGEAVADQNTASGAGRARRACEKNPVNQTIQRSSMIKYVSVK